MKRIYKYLIFIVSGALVLTTSCSDELNTEPKGTVSQSQITKLAESDPAALALVIEPMIAGMYGHLVTFNSMGLSDAQVKHDDHGIKSIFHIADMMGEDVVQTSSSYNWYYHDYLLELRDKDYTHPYFVWQYLYRSIKLANDILAKIPEDAEDSQMKAFRGQALATRAYSYHYLVQFFQKTYVGHEDDPGVPIVTEVESEEGTPRKSMREVYTLMVKDLTDAIKLLDGYSRATKGFIDQSVAYGFLARVYLSMENWEAAADAASKARSGYPIMTGEQYLAGFKYISNPEWMFGSIVTSDLDIVKTGICNHNSFFSSFSYGYASLTGMFKAIDRRLYDHMSDTDSRKLAYQSPDGTTFPDGGYNGVELAAYVNGKFGASDDGADNTQDLVYMRASEMLLIEAEARAEMNQPGEAAALLKELMENRDPNYTVPTSNLLEEIRQQRRIELWGEIGIALFDIKRLKLGINRDYPGSNHPEDAKLVVPAEDWKFTYMLPTKEIDNNPDVGPEDNNP
ncbi:SusD family protein [Mariniphaga anaerophila]|uniref:SusD family protein n=1 Tax=Mariniphaga anaerophila TaxID=1484053 RepID=A0A1M5F6K0_9BACT|nr:RagB/SusD family nutrient uptake outer membrane protein [Mariniphaga anaerophila]SHF87173.1 SusD family protein [Mariniphaga anaerophila]